MRLYPRRCATSIAQSVLPKRIFAFQSTLRERFRAVTVKSIASSCSARNTMLSVDIILVEYFSCDCSVVYLFHYVFVSNSLAVERFGVMPFHDDGVAVGVGNVEVQSVHLPYVP